MVEAMDLFQNITNVAVNKQINLAFILLIFTTIFVIYSIIVFYFYKFLSKKNIIELNLYQYNQYENPSLVKFFAIFFYFIEYIIILPVLTFFWFAILSILILMLSPHLEMGSVLLIAAALVASIRILAYIHKSLAIDVAKIAPFNFMIIAVTTPDFFSLSSLFSRVHEIPALFTDIIYFLFFIMAIEVIMRTADFITVLFGKGEE